MKSHFGVLLLTAVTTCIGLGGCVTMPPSVVTDSDMVTVELAVPTNPDTFVENARKVVADLGYQVVHVGGAGKTRVVTANRQNKSGTYGTYFQNTSVVLTLDQLETSGRTIHVSVSTMSNMGKAESDASPKAIAEIFRKNLQRLSADN